MKKAYYHFLLIAVAGLICYSNTFTVPFQFDDIWNIAENRVIRNLENFTVSFAGYEYNPRRFIGYLTFAVNYNIGALNVTGYHAVNFAIHLLNAFLVYYLVLLTFRTPYFRSQKSECRMQKWEGENRPLHALSAPAATGDSSRRADPPVAGDSRFLALTAALLFIAHPIQTQAVTYIVQRFTSLATMLCLLSVVMYVKGRQSALRIEHAADANSLQGKNAVRYATGPVPYALCSLLFAVLAMRTKEISFTLPVIIVMYEFIFFESSFRKKLLFLLPAILTLLIIPLGMVGLNRPVSDIISDLSEHTRVQTNISRWDYLITEFRVVATYIRLMFLPVNQNLDYDYPVYHSLFTPSVFISLLFLSALFGTAVYLLCKTRRAISDKQSTVRSEKSVVSSKREEAKNDGDVQDGNQEGIFSESHGSIRGSRFTACDSRFAIYRLIAFGILWFFVALSVESSFIPIADVIFEHRMYLPSAGAFITLAALFLVIASKAAGRWQRAERLAVPALSTVVIILMAATYARNAIWQDEELLWGDVMKKSPGNARACNDLGYVLLGKGRTDEAINYLSSAVKLNYRYADAHTNLGVAYYDKDWIDAAIAQFQTAIRLSSSNEDLANSHHNLGLAYVKRGMLAEAAAEMESALRASPDNPEIYSDLGVVYKRKGMIQKAMECYMASLNINPYYAPAYFNLALLYRDQGSAEKAREYFTKAHNLDPAKF